MRDSFYEQMDMMYADLVAICERVETAVGRATQALLTGDRVLAEEVISGDADIDQRREEVEELAFSLLSLQAPVATDLRVVIAALRMVSELERMGDLSVHVAKIARLRVPEVAVPEPLRPTISRMAEVAEAMVGRVSRIIAERDSEDAAALAADDDEMDQLRRATFTALLGSEWPHSVEAAVDVALLGRYYERIADHAVSVANRVVYVVTGEVPSGV